MVLSNITSPEKISLDYGSGSNPEPKEYVSFLFNNLKFFRIVLRKTWEDSIGFLYIPHPIYFIVNILYYCGTFVTTNKTNQYTVIKQNP